MNKFQIENLDFCRSTRGRNASIITGTGKAVEVAVEVSVKTRTRVKGTAGFAVGAAAGAAAARVGGKPVIFVETGISGSID